MLYKKIYSYGLLGNKGSPSTSNKTFGGVKNVGIEFAQSYLANRVAPAVEKQVANYLEKK